MIQITWVGMRIKGTPPKFSPVSTPRSQAEVEKEKAQEAEFRAKVAALRRYSPSARPAQDPPTPG